MTFGLIQARPLGAMRISLDKATLCLSLLTEGSSIRTTERVTGVHRDTICRLLVVASRKGETSPELGDAYTFLGVERTSKLLQSFHVGRRTTEDASIFMAKTAAATSGRFQLSTDGLNAYPAAVEDWLGGRVDYGMLIKTYSAETVDTSAGTARRG